MKGRRLAVTDLFSHPVNFFALGFGAGLAPKAPGTVGTLVAIPLFLAFNSLGLTVYLLLTVLVTFLGIRICEESAKVLGVHDHSGIVWDEIAGYLITMIAVPAQWYWILAGFILFRFFDIVKPWPIRWFDNHVHGGLGIMLDDIMAGFMSLGVIQLMINFFS